MSHHTKELVLVTGADGNFASVLIPELRRRGYGVLPVGRDYHLADDKTVQAIMELVGSARLLAVVNAHGRYRDPQSVASTPLNAFRDLYTDNVLSTVNVYKATQHALLGNGVFIMIGSSGQDRATRVANIGDQGLGPYLASKLALEGLAMAMRVENTHSTVVWSPLGPMDTHHARVIEAADIVSIIDARTWK